MIIASATSSRHAKALSDRVVEDLKSNNILGMHWGTIRLSAEDLWEPPKRFYVAAIKSGYNENQIIELKRTGIII